MRLMFVYWAWEDQGSGNVIQGYTDAAGALGHEVVVYGPPNPKIPLNYSVDMESADAVVFIFEWTTQLQYGDQLDLVRLVAKVPRSRRIIIDGDGNYNEPIHVEDDYNHKDAASGDRWVEFCDSLADKICQPTLHPRRPNVLPFLFYAYSPAWEVPLTGTAKDYTMGYIGHAKFRWRPMRQVLEAIEPVRARLGRIGLVGVGWDQLPWWASQMNIEDWYVSDPEYLKRMEIDVLPPVPFTDVIATMSRSVFNPVLLRPIFRHLQFVTPRIFETLAASTIPLFMADAAYVKEIYGDTAVDLVMRPDDLRNQIVDIVDRPEHYREMVNGIRRHLSVHHSHAARLRQLIDIVENREVTATHHGKAVPICG
jgi:hypothetical protein